MRYFGKTEKGPVRDNNEDYFACDMIGDCLCMAVADGLGGEVCGEIASSIAVNTVMDEMRESLAFVKDTEALKSFLSTLFNKANVKILLDCLEHRERMGMCTTLTVAVIKGNNLTIAHIGDTRCYLCHGHELQKLTNDHNQAAELVMKGEITEDEAKRHPGRNRLMKVLGENQFLEPDVYSYNINYGDIVLLCSDGLYSFISRDLFIKALQDRSNLENICTRLTEYALEGRSTDNMTIVAGVAKPASV